MKCSKIYTIVALVMAIVLTGVVFAQTPVTIVNHSFELPGGSGVINNWDLIPGWDSDRKSWITDEDTSSDGDWNAWCGVRGKYVEQVTSHSLLSGKLYRLKFDTCAWFDNPTLLVEAVADDTDTVLAAFEQPIPGYPNWTEKELQFTANGHVGETLRIQFKMTTTFTDFAGVDNIRLTYVDAETDPPTPNPSTWSQVPTATGPTSITMTATTASDPSGGVKYYFEETTGNPGGDDSGWQTDANYTDTGLTAETTYTYRVRTKDVWENIGLWSTSESETTPAESNPLIQSGKHTYRENLSLNPALRPGPSEWDDVLVESGDAVKVGDTYYWYYHGYHNTYQIGVATATDPCGTWTKYAGNPIIPIGPGDYDDEYTACAAFYEEGETYYLFYWGAGSGYGNSINVATATDPLGPWTKSSNNPILGNAELGFTAGRTYLGGVVKVGGTYYLYVTDAGYTQCDYGPMHVFTASSIYGTWTRYPDPVLSPGAEDEWDDGAFSESEVLYYDGMFHMFYSGAQMEPRNDKCKTRDQVKESIGYAYSSDGFNFTKYENNPVIDRLDITHDPNVSALSEAHFIIEMPYIYVVSTERWEEDWEGHTGCPWCEDLAVNVIEILP